MSRGRTRDEDVFLLNRCKELEEQLEAAERVIALAQDYCDDLNREGSADTAVLEAALAAHNPAREPEAS